MPRKPLPEDASADERLFYRYASRTTWKLERQLSHLAEGDPLITLISGILKTRAERIPGLDPEKRRVSQKRARNKKKLIRRMRGQCRECPNPAKNTYCRSCAIKYNRWRLDDLKEYDEARKLYRESFRSDRAVHGMVHAALDWALLQHRLRFAPE